MAVTQHEAQPADVEQQVYGILQADFADRYLAKHPKVQKFAYSASFNPRNPLCDFEQTWWSNHYIPGGEKACRFVLGMLHRMGQTEVEQQFVEPFEARSKDIDEALREGPLMTINGHYPDLQAALSTYGLARGMALQRSKGGWYGQNFRRMTDASHVIATRAVVPLTVGWPHGPHIPLVGVARSIMSPHFTLSRTPRMHESGIPAEFFSAYNARARQDTLAVLEQGATHPDGYHTVWHMSPNATPDEVKKDEAGQIVRITAAKVSGSTIRLIKAMNCSLLPVLTNFGLGKGPTTMELDDIIPASEVDDQTLHKIMSKLATHRAELSDTEVVYAGDS